MEDAGFVNVVSREFKIPIGVWPANQKLREAGAFQLMAMLEGIQGLTLAFWTRFLGWSAENVEIALAKVRTEFKSKKIHSYWPLYVANPSYLASVRCSQIDVGTPYMDRSQRLPGEHRLGCER